MASVRGCYYGPTGPHRPQIRVTSATARPSIATSTISTPRSDIFPYPDESFETVLCCELIEHLFPDPMHLMAEINRILKPGGHLVLTTPNLASLRAISAILQGYHPGFFPRLYPAAQRRREPMRGTIVNMPRGRSSICSPNSGFEIVRLETGEFLDVPHPELRWIDHLLDRYPLNNGLRGDGIYALGRKTGQ